MSKRIIAQNERIVIGVDVHDRDHCLAVVDGDMVRLKEATIQPAHKAWEKFLERLPGCDVTVVYEAGPHGYNLHDLITSLGHKAAVIAPMKHVGVKTDRRDARAVARDYLARRARVVTVPDYHKRVRRQLLRTRHQLKGQVKQLKNRLNALKRFHGLSGGLPAIHTDDSGYLEFVIERIQQAIEFLSLKVEELQAAMSVAVCDGQYREQADKLTAIKGVGPLTACEVVFGVADITSFSSSARFASYTGLCPGEHSSGERRRQGRITKRGPGSLRGALVQAAWSSVRHPGPEKDRYLALKARIGGKKAIVAMARRLAVRMWWALKEPAPSPPAATA